MEGTFAQRWDCVKQPVLQGSWGKVKVVTVPVGRGKQEDRRCVDITQENGIPLTVWESAGLRVAFDEIEEGMEVYLEYLGLGDAKPGQNAPKLFTVGYQQF